MAPPYVPDTMGPGKPNIISNHQSHKLYTIVDETGDGAKLTDVHSVSVDYIKGVPLLFSCVADIGREQEERRGPRVLH